MTKSQYDSNTYNLLSNLLEAKLGTFTVMIENNQRSMDDIKREIIGMTEAFNKRQDAQDKKIDLILTEKIPAIKITIGKMLGWSACAGAMGAIVLQVSIFAISKWL